MINLNTQKTEVDVAKEELMTLNNLSTSTLEHLAQNALISYKLFWDNNPELKAQILGTEALKLFTVSSIIQQAIKQIKETIGEEYTPLTIPEGKTITWKEDGSCEIC